EHISKYLQQKCTRHQLGDRDPILRPLRWEVTKIMVYWCCQHMGIQLDLLDAPEKLAKDNSSILLHPLKLKTLTDLTPFTQETIEVKYDILYNKTSQWNIH
ncbi:hypothetical protein L9F63_008828, partial [Diploptera punctata]